MPGVLGGRRPTEGSTAAVHFPDCLHRKEDSGFSYHASIAQVGIVLPPDASLDSRLAAQSVGPAQM